MQQEKSFSLLEAEIARVTVENGELKQHLSDTNDLSQHTVDVISVGAGKDGKSVVPNGMDGAISVENLKNEGELPSGVVHSFFYRQSSVLGHFIGIIVVELKNEMKSHGMFSPEAKYETDMTLVEDPEQIGAALLAVQDNDHGHGMPEESFEHSVSVDNSDDLALQNGATANESESSTTLYPSISRWKS